MVEFWADNQLVEVMDGDTAQDWLGVEPMEETWPCEPLPRPAGEDAWEAGIEKVLWALSIAQAVKWLADVLIR